MTPEVEELVLARAHDCAKGCGQAYGEEYPTDQRPLPLSTCLRELATAWGESEAVRQAVEAWRRGRSV